MTLTPSQEEEVRNAWNEKQPVPFHDRDVYRAIVIECICPNCTGYRKFRSDFITTKGWDKEDKKS